MQDALRSSNGEGVHVMRIVRLAAVYAAEIPPVVLYALGLD